MAQQIAAIFSPIIQNVDGSFEPKFSPQLQSNETYSGSIEQLPDGSKIPVVKDFVPSEDTLVTLAGITICYVKADENRITNANWNGTTKTDYLVLWRMYTDEPFVTSQMPDDNMTGVELSTILAYLSFNTGYLSSTITQWVINNFEVNTQQEAVTWATTRPRTATVKKLLIAMQKWQDAKAELDNLA